MKLSSPWLKHGFWNTLEHGITRGSDALASLVLLWALSPETFAKLASSQALIAPVLFLFISPENVLYRDYAVWRGEGTSALAARLYALRRFALGKAQVALILSVVLAMFTAGNFLDRFFALLWAFSLVLAPQISGPDREFLRLDLKLKTLNALGLYQKLSMLAGTVIAAFVFPGHIGALAAFAVFSTLSSALIASHQVKKQLRLEGAGEDAIRGRIGPSVISTLKDALTTFSAWQHVIGVIIGWVQTMDLFFLSLMRFPGKEVGLYAAVLKVANFSLMLPTALASLFIVWAGRRASEEGQPQEIQEVKRLTGWLGVGVLFQGVLLYLLAPYLFSVLSHGRWSDLDISVMKSWLGWILTGASIFGTLYLASSWLGIRTRLSSLFGQVYLPWVVASFLIYFGCIRFPIFASPYQGAAIANVMVAGVFALLIICHLGRVTKTSEGIANSLGTG
jgi:hypothetical protein